MHPLTVLRHFPGPCMRTHGGRAWKREEQGVETACIPWRKKWFTAACGEGSDSCLEEASAHTDTHKSVIFEIKKKKSLKYPQVKSWINRTTPTKGNAPVTYSDSLNHNRHTKFSIKHIFHSLTNKPINPATTVMPVYDVTIHSVVAVLFETY